MHLQARRLSMTLEKAKELRVGDEVLLRNGTTMIITYIKLDVVEGFNSKGWITSPTIESVINKTGNHYDLPIKEEII